LAALRSLAVIEHETRQFSQAAAHNSEALRLATAPSARARILLRLAAGSAALGQLDSAMRLLDPLIAFPPNGDALVRAQALVERAKLRRGVGELAAARRDIESSLDTLQEFEALTDEFDARVELAHIEHAANNDDAALEALARALRLTGEIMSQTANPEYRASIADSLRPALDLKIDLLWRRHERLTSGGNAASARAVALEALRAADNSRALAFDQLRAQRRSEDRAASAAYRNALSGSRRAALPALVSRGSAWRERCRRSPAAGRHRKAARPARGGDIGARRTVRAGRTQRGAVQSRGRGGCSRRARRSRIH
jgi:hypothetical protein